MIWIQLKFKFKILKLSFKELGIIAIARGSQDIVSHNVTNRTPSQNIHNVEPNRVIGLEEAHILLSPSVPSLEMCHPVLLRQPLLGHILSLEVEEHKPPKEERETGAQADDQRWVQLSFHNA